MDPEEEKLLLIVIVVVIFAFVVYFELRIMRGKSKAARKIDVRKDEAYNAILTCRSVINVLERQGSNVREARALVDKAKSAMQRGDHETAIDLCERARDDLTKVRSPPAVAARGARAEPEREERFESFDEEAEAAPRPRRAEDSYTGSRLEVQGGPNYLVAKFELNTAREEIAKGGGRGGNVSKASDILEDAQAEFDAGNYAKALSLAVKAKKAASPQGSDEAIPLRKGPKAERPSRESEGEAEGVVDVCPSCGSEIDPEDEFCGSCGKRREMERVCPSCGRVASSSDRFCRKCGSRVP